MPEKPSPLVSTTFPYMYVFNCADALGKTHGTKNCFMSLLEQPIKPCVSAVIVSCASPPVVISFSTDSELNTVKLSISISLFEASLPNANLGVMPMLTKEYVSAPTAS